MADQAIWYVAVFMTYWGRGHSKQEALKAARKAGASGSEYYVKKMPPGTVDPWVNDFGDIRWTWDETVTDDEGRDGQPVVVAVGRSVRRSKLSEKMKRELAHHGE